MSTIPVVDAARYEIQERLGAGGMGEVFRAWDTVMQRTVALKVVREDRVERFQERFVQEGRIQGVLSHPGIVPVLDLGRLPDGRGFFTMPVVAGMTLSEGISRARQEDGLGVGPSTMRLLSALVGACDAVGYAHSRGTLHLDLKPDNLMIGAHGEVRVLDWGLAQLTGERTGSTEGTLAYMAPEQHKGRDIGPWSDVYALGGCLFAILTGQAPLGGELLEMRSRMGDTDPFPHPEATPRPLQEVVLRTRAWDPRRRLPDAGALAEVLRRYLDGARAREDALLAVTEAERLQPDIERLRESARALRHQAAAMLAALPSWAPLVDKEPGWAAEQTARQMEQQAAELTQRWLSLLREALASDPATPEAHQALAAHYRRRHEAAEALGDTLLVGHLEDMLRHHERGEHRLYLAGTGALSLVTDPPGCRAWLMAPERVQRRVCYRFVRDLGLTPLQRVPLGMGGHLIVLFAPGTVPAAAPVWADELPLHAVRYPLWLRRGEHWDGVPPGAHVPLPVPVPALQPAEHRWIPPGWTWVGGDPEALHALERQRIWVDGFWMSTHPVTNADYLQFLNALIDQGRIGEALQHQPQIRGAGGTRLPIFTRDAQSGHFTLGLADAEGDAWLPDYPVTLIDHAGAMAFCSWRAAETGRPCRLPGELEFEKAARGPDGRPFPTGPYMDPTWTCCRGSRPGRPLPAVISDYPLDASPYGVRHVAGNMRTWCLDAFRESTRIRLHESRYLPLPIHAGEEAVVRGGGWDNPLLRCRLAGRAPGPPVLRHDCVGMRWVEHAP